MDNLSFFDIPHFGLRLDLKYDAIEAYKICPISRFQTFAFVANGERNLTFEPYVPEAEFPHQGFVVHGLQKT